jgi:hypothetical protein
MGTFALNMNFNINSLKDRKKKYVVAVSEPTVLYLENQIGFPCFVCLVNKHMYGKTEESEK